MSGFQRYISGFLSKDYSIGPVLALAVWVAQMAQWDWWDSFWDWRGWVGWVSGLVGLNVLQALIDEANGQLKLRAKRKAAAS